MYELNYWVVGHLSDDPSQLIRLAAVVRGVESAGQCISYGVNSTAWRLDAVAALNTAQWALSVIPGWLAIRHLGILPDGTYIHGPRTYAPDADRPRLQQSGLATAEYDLKRDE